MMYLTRMLYVLFWVAASCRSAVSVALQQKTQTPIVESRAGIFRGRYLSEFDQDLFLGIKYAPKPVRFAPSKLKEDSPKTTYNVTKYGLDCHGYGSDTTTLVNSNWTVLGEDCLHLNVIRPSGQHKNLPILVWIYGGGWQQGSTSDPRYVHRYSSLMHR